MSEIITTWRVLRERLTLFLSEKKEWHTPNDCALGLCAGEDIVSIRETRAGRPSFSARPGYEAIPRELNRMADEGLILKVKRNENYLDTNGYSHAAYEPVFAVPEVPALCEAAEKERTNRGFVLANRFRVASEWLVPICGPAKARWVDGGAEITLSLEQYEALADHVREKGEPQ